MKPHACQEASRVELRLSPRRLGDTEGGSDPAATGGANAVALGESGRLSIGNLGDPWVNSP